MPDYIALDVGGSHITSGLISFRDNHRKIESIFHRPINSKNSADKLLDNLLLCIHQVADKGPIKSIKGICISIPGPFDYENGVCKITGVNKFESLYGVDFKNTLVGALSNLQITPDQITFLNDSQAFLMGVLEKEKISSEKVLALTIGTGLGSASYADGRFYSGLLDDEYLYDCQFKDGRAEDYFSTNWFLKQVENSGVSNDIKLKGVKDLANNFESSEVVQSIFHNFGKNLAEYLNSLINQKDIDRIVFGGSIFQSFHLFEKSFRDHFSNNTTIQLAKNTSDYSIMGAATHHFVQSQKPEKKKKIRDSVSEVLPKRKKGKLDGYDIYPTFPMGDQKIKKGYKSLVQFIGQMQVNKVIFDGNVGTIWQDVVNELNSEFINEGKKVLWFNIDACLKQEDEISKMLEIYLGGDDPLFGFKYPGIMSDFFDENAQKKINPGQSFISILYGTGAALAGWDAPLIYIDQSKNEIKYRSRAGSITNLGAGNPGNPNEMYKRFYFVDWPVCNRYKKELLHKVDVFVDGQRPDTITWTAGENFRSGLQELVKSPFRVRPWFEPGVWGGSWMKNHFKNLNEDAPNFAWSFEIIAPENGVIFESNSWMLEVDFEFLMSYDNEAILGRHAEIYGGYFPLRFNYLDTINGENLSLQCHPRLNYIQNHFGEQITQDESYYIMDAGSEANVYLGFQESINTNQFQSEFQECEKSGKKVDVETYVQSFPSKKHDLFLIPSGTIHCSGKNNMVLEISNTPYIFTFKIYDWQRLDLDGKPRPLNVNRALENLKFDRKGSLVEKTLISKPEIMEESEDWKVVNLPTHKEHLYSIHRLEFEKSIRVHTENRFHILNLVEGESVYIISKNNKIKLYYAETIIVPAATGEYIIENCTSSSVRVVKAFMK